MRFFETLKNIFAIDELRKRILFTLLLIAIYRLGSYIVLPGADVEALQNSVGEGSANDLLGLINLFTGGAFNNASIMALGIMPYITASIIVQLLGFAVPYFQKLQSTEGESGRKKLSQITRALTVAITLVQGAGYLTYIKSNNGMSSQVDESLFWLSGIVILSTGTIFAMWLGERITDRGIGNGVSLLITVGIIVGLPTALAAEFVQKATGAGGLIVFVLEMVAFFFVTLLTVMIVTGIRKIPLQFAKRSVGRGDASAPTKTARDYIPLKVNASGVMPIIFAQALMMLPVSLAGFGGGQAAQTSWVVQQFNDFTSPLYNVVYFFLVVIFTYVYTALVVNPGQYTEYLRRQNAFIPGVRGGLETEEYIDSITSRITLPGSIILGLIAILPAIVAQFGVNTAFAIFFGGTSLIIMVGVVLDTLQQIESYLLMRKYDGLVKEGKIEGRGGGSRMQSLGADF